MPALPWKSFAAPKSDREYTTMVTYLPLNWFRGTAEVHEVHPPDSAPASRVRRAGRILHGRQRNWQRVLDVVGVGRRASLEALRPPYSPRRGDEGPAGGHGQNRVRSMEGERIIYPTRLGCGQGAYPRAADIGATSNLSSHPHRKNLFTQRRRRGILRSSRSAALVFALR
jgi:hypothetical protein